MMRFPTPIPTPAMGKRSGDELILRGSGRRPPLAPPLPAPSSLSQSCYREQTHPKGFNPLLPFTPLSKKPFYGLYFVHAAKTYDWMISRLIAEITRVRN